MMEFGR